MSMKILRANVAYRGDNNIVITYGETETADNQKKAYYFLDTKDKERFTNGNRIATTNYYEVVDSIAFPPANVGVVDPEGNEVIPFVNKLIKPVNDNVIIVESASPVSESVKEAIKVKDDASNATMLVSTAAAIKERLNQQMGGEGTYLFNNQFSEATVYDINGNNLVNNETYSYIATANNKLYLSKNVADSVINEYPLVPSAVQSNDVENVASQPIDLSATSVDQNVIENAMASATSETPVSSNDMNLENNVAVPAVPVGSETSVQAEAPVAEAPVQAEVAPETDVQAEAPVAEAPVQAEVAPDTDIQAEVSVDEAPVQAEVAPETDVQAEVPVDAAPVQAEVAPETDVQAEIPVDAAPVQEEVVPETDVQAEVPVDAAPVQEEVVPETDVQAENLVDAAPAQEEVAPETDVQAENPVDVAPAQEEVAPETDVQAEIPVDAVPVQAEVAPETDVQAEIPVDAAPVQAEVAPETDVQAEAPIDESQVQAEVAPETDVQAEIPVDAETSIENEEDINNIFEENNSNISESDSFTDSEKDDFVASEINPDFNNDDYSGFNDIKTDKIVNIDDYYNEGSSYSDFDSYSYESNFDYEGSSMLADVEKSINGLVSKTNSLVRENLELMSQNKAKDDSINKLRKDLSSVENRNKSLTTMLRESSSSKERLESKNRLLEQKNHELERINSMQTREINSLKQNMAGFKDVFRLLDNARNQIDDRDYDETQAYYRRAA